MIGRDRMRFPPSLLDEIRARLPVSTVVARTVPLKRKGREFAGLSPFKDEKTPSFFVNDQKGFYHCFASGEHGDIFKFLMTTQGLSFPEAVTTLAEEAGVALPKFEQADPRVEEQRDRWYRLLETATAFFQDTLFSAQGRNCLTYLKDKRELSDATIEMFRIGYAPDSRTALGEHLGGHGFTPHEMAAMGVLIAGDDIPRPYDRFRNRAIFPIEDLKGRVIAFGGRALSADQPAKYLNSPETPLFHKGHQLYNAHRARKAAYDNQRIIVVEGYMDVVALAQAGITEAVAPLGTALTEDQVKLLWRFNPEPTLCFDGDGAGRKAAHRALDTALHLLKPGVSLKFAFLPDGMDPDDLIKDGGNRAIGDILSAARPFADILFEREWTSGDWGTPERRAQLETQVGTLIARIEDQGVRTHYQRDMRDRLYQAWSKARGKGGYTQRAGSGGNGAGGMGRRVGHSGANGGGKRQSGSRPGQPAFRSGAGGIERTSSLRQSGLVAGLGSAASPREVLIVTALLNHPWLIEEDAEEIARIEFTSPRLERLRNAILSTHAGDISLDSTTLRSHLSADGWANDLQAIDRAASHKCDKFALAGAEHSDVESGWRDTLKLHERQLGLRKALEAAERSWHDESNEASFARIRELQQELAALNAGHD